MNVLGLFSGIGGFELGFERAGFNIAAMCEIEPYCQAVLRRHWPGVPIFSDVRSVTGASVAHLGIDVVTGGFPCQDISLAGKGAGLTGERSGLFFEMHRVIAEVRPRWVVAENVSALRSRGLDTVLRSLAAIGYDAEWHCIPASAVGAPHRRDRVWVVAHHADRCRGDGAAPVEGSGTEVWRPQEQDRGLCGAVADAIGARLEGCAGVAGDTAGQLAPAQRSGEVPAVSNADGARCAKPLWSSEAILRAGTCEFAGQDGGRWVEPDVDRVVNGLSAHMDCIGGIPIDSAPRPTKGKTSAGRVHRLRALGNAVVPQIPEIIARAILLRDPGAT